MTNWGAAMVFNPYGLFFTETDEEKAFSWRVCSAFKKAMITIVCTMLIIIPSYANLN
jgi:hypothetical protein